MSAKSQALNDRYDAMTSFRHVSPPTGSAIIFVNGILTPNLDAAKHTIRISQRINNIEVHPSHNDPSQIDASTQDLIRTIKRFHKECQTSLHDAGQRIDKVRLLLIAHSHGTVISQKALESQHLAQIKSCIKVITIGPAKLVPITGLKGAKNFINRYDPIPLFTHLPLNKGVNFIVDMLVDLQDKADNFLLQIDNFNNPNLKDRLVSAFVAEQFGQRLGLPQNQQLSWACSIVSVAQDTLKSQPPTNAEWQSFLQRLCVSITYHVFYDIIVTDREGQPACGYNFESHGVEAYLNTLSRECQEFIDDQKALLDQP